MTFRDKVDLIRKKKGIKSKEDLALVLELNYPVMSRNIRDNKITIDFVIAIGKHMGDIDLNWLIKEEDNLKMVNEPATIYGLSTPEKISLIKQLLDEIGGEIK